MQIKQKRKRQKPNKHGIKKIYLLPNLFTTGNIVAGVLSILYTVQGKYEPAVYAILAGCLFDILDGRIARLTRTSSTFGINYDYESNTLKIAQDGKVIYKKDLMDFANLLIDKYGTNSMDQSLSQKEMTFEDGNDKVEIKIQFLNIAGNKNTSSDKIESKDFEFYVVVKLK